MPTLLHHKVSTNDGELTLCDWISNLQAPIPSYQSERSLRSTQWTFTRYHQHRTRMNLSSNTHQHTLPSHRWYAHLAHVAHHTHNWHLYLVTSICHCSILLSNFTHQVTIQLNTLVLLPVFLNKSIAKSGIYSLEMWGTPASMMRLIDKSSASCSCPPSSIGSPGFQYKWNSVWTSCSWTSNLFNNLHISYL